MKLQGLFKVGVASKREKMAYWLTILGFAMYLVSVIAKVSLIETAAMYTPIAAAGGWYINKETQRKSTDNV